MGKVVVEIGPREHPKARTLSEYKDPDEVQVLYLDIDPRVAPDVVADAGQPLPFADGSLDGIFASHILEHIPYRKELAVLQDWARCLKPGGWLHVFVPSWEWVARQVLSEKPCPGLKPYAFAGQINQFDVHINMFTIRQLRALFERADLSVVRARTLPNQLFVGDRQYEAEEHYIAGIKEFPPPLAG